MGLFTRKAPTTLKVPLIGDPVWWCPKQLGCIVTKVEGDIITFQGGEIVENTKGRQVPRWTVMCKAEFFMWEPEINMWYVGQGQKPKNVRGTIITPDPVRITGKSTGSFART